MSSKAIKLNPIFEDLGEPETFINHIEKLKGKSDRRASEPTPHNKILNQLLAQIEPVDFELLAFPEAEALRKDLEQATTEMHDAMGANGEDKNVKFTLARDKVKRLEDELRAMKLNQKHYLVLTVEQVLQTARKNRWSLCRNQDFVYVYNGCYWSLIDKEPFQQFLGEAAEAMGVAKFTARFFQFREQLLKQFLATEYLPTPESNKGTVLINLKNGTFVVTDGRVRLRPYRQEDFLTYQLPFEYDPKAKAPLFTAYLNKVLPDEESRKVLAEFMGYVFIKHGSNRLKEEKALILYGTGANGKSVFFEIVNALLGNENISSYSLQSLTDVNGYYRAMIANRLVNYASEINGKLEASTFKQMVSGEPIEARLPYGKPMQISQYAKLIFNCNELPKDVEHTNAYFRRFLILPFGVTIPEATQDKQLHSKIIDAELPGVFNWVLDGLHRLLEKGRFSECKAAKQAVEQYRKESDSVAMFLEDNGYQPHPEKTIATKDLYIAYKAYCLDDGFKSASHKTFNNRLRALGCEVKRMNAGNVAHLIKHDTSLSSV